MISKSDFKKFFDFCLRQAALVVSGINDVGLGEGHMAGLLRILYQFMFKPLDCQGKLNILFLEMMMNYSLVELRY